jgi:hypothetical protein
MDKRSLTTIEGVGRMAPLAPSGYDPRHVRAVQYGGWAKRRQA